MDRGATRQHPAPARMLTHIKGLADGFGDFLVRALCKCGACREIPAHSLARLVGYENAPEEALAWVGEPRTGDAPDRFASFMPYFESRRVEVCSPPLALDACKDCR